MDVISELPYSLAPVGLFIPPAPSCGIATHWLHPSTESPSSSWASLSNYSLSPGSGKCPLFLFIQASGE